MADLGADHWEVSCPVQQNDPWAPLPNERPNMLLQSPPQDPLHDMISSERYLQTLETKLKRLKGTKNGQVTSKEMLRSLEKVKDDQMQHFVTEQTFSSGDAGIGYMPVFEDSFSASLHRRLHPEKQAVDPQELVALLHEDVLAKVVESAEDIKEVNDTNVMDCAGDSAR